MKVDTMRWIDYYIGVPLCFIGSIINNLVLPFRKEKNNYGRNILFIELSEMGSAILVDPAMRKLQKEIDAKIHFVIFNKNKPSLDFLHTVSEENIYTIRENNMFLFILDTLRFFIWTRRKRIDAAIDLELFSRFTALLSAFSGASKKVGFHAFYNEGLYRGSFLTHKVAYNPHIHIAKNFIALVNALLSPLEEIPYSKKSVGNEEIILSKITFSNDEKKELIKIVTDCFKAFNPKQHKIVLINPNASELLIQRRWPPQHYTDLIKSILKTCSNAVILITGDPKERAEAEVLKESVQSERCINFAGMIKLAQLPVLYSISEFMITNDSGPGHFAAITEMPTFVIFGPETPALYGSLGKTTPIYAGLACSPCVSAANHRKTACKDNICLQVIKPDHVLEIIKPDIEKINAE